MHYCQNNRGAKIAWAESGADAVVSKRAYTDAETVDWLSYPPYQTTIQSCCTWQNRRFKTSVQHLRQTGRKLGEVGGVMAGLDFHTVDFCCFMKFATQRWWKGTHGLFVIAHDASASSSWSMKMMVVCRRAVKHTGLKLWCSWSAEWGFKIKFWHLCP